MSYRTRVALLQRIAEGAGLRGLLSPLPRRDRGHRPVLPMSSPTAASHPNLAVLRELLELRGLAKASRISSDVSPKPQPPHNTDAGVATLLALLNAPPKLAL